MAGIAVISAACDQSSSSSSTKSPGAVTDISAENLKGKVQQVETDTYLVDSATGKMDKLDSKSIETFDENGYTASYSNFTTKDSATMLYKYEHNANGFMLGMVTTKNDKPFSSMKIEVDSLGKYSLATSFDSTGKMDVFYDEITSNEYGQVLSAKGHHPDSTLKMSFINNYDSIYYTGGKSKDSVGKLTYSSSIQLNDKKDPAQMDETSVTRDSTTNTNTTYAYDTWDDKGNWTQQTASEKGKPKKIIKRTITYK